LEEEVHLNADAVLEKVVDEPGLFAVPELFTFEVFFVLERLHPAGLETFQNGILPLLQGGIFVSAKRTASFPRLEADVPVTQSCQISLNIP
jgi:hypothetical protein